MSLQNWGKGESRATADGNTMCARKHSKEQRKNKEESIQNEMENFENTEF